MAELTEPQLAGLLAEARKCLAAADLHGVEEYGRKILAVAPETAEAWFLMGAAALRAGQVTEAGKFTEKAVAIDGGRADYRAQLARCFSMIFQHPTAVRHAADAMALGPQDAQTHHAIGLVFLQADQPSAALEALAQAVAMKPDVARFQFDLALAHRFLGDLRQAELACEAALRADPGFFGAQSMLAELQGTSVSGKRLLELEDAYKRLEPDAALARLHLGFALSRAYEAHGEFEKAFSVLRSSKKQMRERLAYRITDDQALFGAIIRLFDSPARFSDTAGFQSEQPIFVMGMPRTGTTLVDRVLSRHRDICSAGEVHNFGIILQRATGGHGMGVPQPGVLQQAMSLDFSKLGEDYVRSIRPEVTGSKHFVDKLPHNFLFAGHIALALPHARMICLRRNPMDTCLGNFRQLFAPNFAYYHYSYDLLETGQYFVAFDALLRHWQAVMPGRILELSYESLVREPETEIRRLVTFCGLDWDPACLSMQDNTAPVTSASAVQVREPINTKAVGRWRSYAPQLAELRAMLEAAGIDTRSV